MTQKVTRKVFGKIGLLYGIVLSIINYIGFRIASSGNMPISQEEDFKVWIEYLENNASLFGFFSVMSFVIPILICIIYIKPRNEKNIVRRLINIPLVYSLYGSLGWLISLIIETFTLIYLQICGILEMKSIFLSSLFNMCQICLFIFTFAFLILDLFHRKVVLPKLFPNGQLSQYPGVINFSSGRLITIFYLSVGIFPITFLLSTFYSYSINYNFKVQLGVLLVTLIIIMFGIAMTAFFADHFSSPLRKLKAATKEVCDSNYDVVVDVVSSDEFGELADNFNEMTYTLKEKTAKILAIQDSIIKGMAVMVEQRDNSTGGHISRTSDCVRVFMDYIKATGKYSFTDSFIKAMIKAAPMHDLGKIAVDDEILRKPGRFEPDEYEKMKAHAKAGSVIVKKVLSEVEDEEFKTLAVNVAHYHHEKWDGTGYPEKIKGTQIPIEARIMALADVFDALVSKRCYKDRMSYDKAFDIIKGDLGTHFDPDLGALFLECREALEALYDGYDCEVQ